MIKSIIKYVGIALVLVGVFLVMKNLFDKETNLSNKNKTNTKTATYSVTVRLLDKETNKYVKGSKLVLKNEDNKIVAEWTTTNKARTIKKLEKGKYTLEQVEASENYQLNKEKITFEITNDNQKVVMYNTKMTEEEIKESNTTNTEVGVDNTASNKNIFTSIIAAIMMALGTTLIYKTRKNY